MAAVVDNDLICNFKKCRKRLVDFAWVTSCSHTFCEEDGEREFSNSFVCPACGHKLEGKHDIIRQDLQPSEEWKSMILAALKPDTIMEIASRALAYWAYQTQQERIYNDYAMKRAKEARDKLETYFQQIVNKLQNEIKSIKIDDAAKASELTETRKRYNELTEQYQEKVRQHQKLQNLYDTLRRKSIVPASIGESSDHGKSKSRPTSSQSSQQKLQKGHQFQMTLGANVLTGSSRSIPNSLMGDQPLFHTKPKNFSRTPPQTSDGESFVLKPYPTPVQTSLDQDDDDRLNSSFPQRFTMSLNTPNK